MSMERKGARYLRHTTHETGISRLKAFLTTVPAKLKALIFLALVAEPFVASLTQIHARVKEVILQACNFGTFIAKAEVVVVLAEDAHLKTYYSILLVLKLGNTAELFL